MLKKIYKLILVILLISPSNSLAQNPINFVQSTVNKASDILKQNISKELGD